MVSEKKKEQYENENVLNLGWTGPSPIPLGFPLRVTLFILIAILSFLIARASVLSLPSLSAREHTLLRTLPRSNNDLLAIDKLLARSLRESPIVVTVCYTVVYVVLQAFAVPGSAFLSVIAGAMYGFYKGIALVTVCVVAGASACYMLSAWLAREDIRRWLPGRTQKLQGMVIRHRGDLMNYMMTLRVTPVVPNWFINIAAPVVGIPYWHFFISTLIGVLPATILQVSTGIELRNIAEDESGANSIRNFAILLGLGVLSLFPVFLKKKLKQQ